MSESDSLIQTGSNQQRRSKCKSRLCLQSKAATLIILWTVFTGVAYTTICAACVLAIAVHIKLASIVTYPTSIVYAVLAIYIVATLYPLIGFVADVSCGRFKMVISCFCLILFSYLVTWNCVVVVEILMINPVHHQPLQSL